MSDGYAVVLRAHSAHAGPHTGRGIGRTTAALAPLLERMVPAHVLGADPGHPPAGLRGRPLVYHVMSPIEPGPLERVSPPWARLRPHALVTTLYDLLPLEHRERFLADRVTRWSYLRRLDLYRSAEVVLAISRATAAAATERLGIPPERVHRRRERARDRCRAGRARAAGGGAGAGGGVGAAGARQVPARRARRQLAHECGQAASRVRRAPRGGTGGASARNRGVRGRPGGCAARAAGRRGRRGSRARRPCERRPARRALSRV